MSMYYENRCPACEADLQGKPIPEDQREAFGGETHFSRVIGVEIAGGYDGVSIWRCPDCGHEEDRFA